MNAPLTGALAPAAAIALSVMLAACSPQPEAAAPPPSASASPATHPSETASPDPTPPSETSGTPMASTPIRVTIAGSTLDGTLDDSPAARALVDRLPLSLEFADYGGQEVLAPLSPGLSMEGMPAGESAPVGTIGYYAPDNVLVLYYTEVGRFNGIVRLGQIQGDIDTLRGWDRPREVSLELAG